MAEDWWDTGGDWGFGGFGDTTPTYYNDYADIGSVGAWNPSDYQFGMPASTYADFGGGVSDPGSYLPVGAGAGTDIGAGGGGLFSGLGNPFVDSRSGALNWSTLLGLGGGLTGLIGQLVGGGQGATTSPVLGTAQKAQIGQANQALSPYAAGTSPLQQMQMSLLQSLASGQGLPPGYAQLVEQAFQPQLGSLYEQAANAGRARGFHDAPATAPPGGAVLGPGLANLQGQMAATKLGLMQSLPQLYNAPIQTAAGAASNQAQSLLNAASLGRGQTTSQPLAPQIGATIGSGLQGIGQAIEKQNQTPFEQALRQLQASGMGITLSGQPRY